MRKNYFKLAYRNLMRNKFTSFIHLFGLTVGMSCCLLITAYILTELSYDRYNKNADRIYRVTRSFNSIDGAVTINLCTIAPPFAPNLANDFPDIQQITQLLDNGRTGLRYHEKLFSENHVYYADEHLFDLFTVDVLRGNPKTALTAPFTMMLTEEIAKKYFGNEDPINKTVRYNNHYDFKVSGIFKAFPKNAHLHPEVLLSFNTLRDSAVYGVQNLRTDWGNNSFFTYLLLPENYPVNNMTARFPAFLDKYVDRTGMNGVNPSQLSKLGLQKLTDIHLRSHTDSEAEQNGDINRIYILSAIALFILLIACINYMNLSTARSTLRAAEIGIRKVIGAKRMELIFQFLSESVMLCLVAILFSLLLSTAAMPLLNKISGEEGSLSILLQWQILVPLLTAPLVIGIIAGIYPALFMSSFQPIKTLKGLFRAGGGSSSFRKVLVVGQFGISIVLIIATAIVFQQLHYMQQKSLGYDKDQVLLMPYGNDVSKQFNTFRTELLRNSAFRNLSRSSRIPTGRLLDELGVSGQVGDSVRLLTNISVKYVGVDYDFIPTYGIKLLAGRNFSRDYSTDTAAYVLNASAVHVLGWKNPEDAVGRDFTYGGTKGHIIGVVNDFIFESMHQQILPMVLVMFPPAQEFYTNISIKIGGSDSHAALSYLENTWRKLFPEAPFQFSFLDEHFDNLYQSEQKQGTIFFIFAGIAIFIACLGLLGLSSFTIFQRVKEIGIRKVLGASTSGIVMLLSTDFLKLVAISAVIAFPVAWYAMNSWLNDFAFRINIQWWVFVLAGMLAIVIALGTVGFQAIKVAKSNVVNSLRGE
jgi:putative ABC transport system permease protein